MSRWVRTGAVLLAGFTLLSGCRGGDPACLGRNAADVLPGRAAYRAMTPAQRADEARRFDDLAGRCGWEP